MTNSYEYIISCNGARIKTCDSIISNNWDVLTQDILSTEISKIISPVLFAGLCIEFDAYDKLIMNNISTKMIQTAFQCYYKTSKNKFSPYQLNAIMKADGDLTISSFVPFKAESKKRVGILYKTEDSLEIVITNKVNVGDLVSIDDVDYTIEEIKYLNEKIKTAYPIPFDKNFRYLIKFTDLSVNNNIIKNIFNVYNYKYYN